jgi:hypothetical protein
VVYKSNSVFICSVSVLNTGNYLRTESETYH